MTKIKPHHLTDCILGGQHPVGRQRKLSGGIGTVTEFRGMGNTLKYGVEAKGHSS